MMATRPYASGGAYINRMSDSCADSDLDAVRDRAVEVLARVDAGTL